MTSIRNVCVYCGSSDGNDPIHIAAAEKLGALLAHAGIGLVYGGGNNGLMGTTARAVLENGGNVIGINTTSLTLDDTDTLDPIYEVQTAFTNQNQTNSVLTVPSTALLDELGDILTTEDGTALGV